MIPLNITDEVVLRRTLEEIEATIPHLNYTLTTIGILPDRATNDEVVTKTNEIIASINTIINTFNQS